MLAINRTHKIFNSFALVALLTASTATYAMEELREEIGSHRKSQGNSSNERNSSNPYSGEGPLNEGTLYPNVIPDFRPYWERTGQNAREDMKASYRIITEQNYEIMERGYRTKSGVTIKPEDLGISVSINGSVKSSPILDQNRIGTHPEQTIQFLQTDTVSGASHLLRNGHEKVVILNFANRTRVGGGYTTGAGAQEEFLCRGTTLYPVLDALKDKGFYPIGHDELIYSPDIMVIRNGPETNFEFRDQPFKFGVLTQAAFDFRGPEKTISDGEYTRVTRQKIRQQIAEAANRGADALVLGAFGCGAFANDPQVMASLYREALEEPQHKGLFRTVLFPIPSGTGNYEKFFTVFQGLAVEVQS